MIIVLLLISIILFVATAVILTNFKLEYTKYKIELENLQKMSIDNINLSKQLYKLYSCLQESQGLQIKAFDLMSKNQKLTIADLSDFREQVSNVLVEIIQQISPDASPNKTIKSKAEKTKLN